MSNFEEEDAEISGDDEEFDANGQDSDTSPVKKGSKRKKSVFIDEAASEDDEVRSVWSGNLLRRLYKILFHFFCITQSWAQQTAHSNQ